MAKNKKWDDFSKETQASGHSVSRTGIILTYNHDSSHFNTTAQTYHLMKTIQIDKMFAGQSAPELSNNAST